MAKIGSDLFDLEGVTYLLVVDYFSRYPEVIRLNTTTSQAIISALKSIFSRYGIPEILISDNGPQYISQEMKDFAMSYGFQHIISSPYFPQSNGQAERMVKTVKTLLSNNKDHYMALLNYRATPLPWCGHRMGRQIRTMLPQTKEILIPTWHYLNDFKWKNEREKNKQKLNFDHRHRVHSLPEIPDDTPVWVTSRMRQIPGNINHQAETPISYVVNKPSGQVRRNHRHLTVKLHDTTKTIQNEKTSRERDSNTPMDNPGRVDNRSPIMTRSWTGAGMNPPD